MTEKAAPASEPYTTIIGLEVHVQLQTQTKLFCGCRTTFGSPPNTQVCPTCLGLPGSLPVMNREAFQLALRAALALDCEIARFTKWDRKNYFYPDLPKGYQISQYDLPFSSAGALEVVDPKGAFTRRVRITRVHLEEDAGKSMHDEAAGTGDSRIDLNRAGTPLCEIVSEPDLRSPQEARAWLNELKLLLVYLGVSDCNMQEGSLRVDANVNLHIPRADGSVAKTPIVEIKNMNSFRSVERALAYEAVRQWEEWRRTRQRPQADPRLGRPRRHHPRPAAQGGVERLPLLPRARSGARHGFRARHRGGPGRDGRAASGAPAGAGRAVEDHPVRRRCAREPGPGTRGLLRGAGHARQRRQAGEQLDATGRAPHTERAGRYDR
jgi:hypothetical protein